MELKKITRKTNERLTDYKFRGAHKLSLMTLITLQAQQPR